MIRVHPIRKLDQIQRIRRNLKTPKTALFYCLFVLGINTNLRVSDLARLTWRNVLEEDTTDLCEHINLTEKKTGKKRRIKMSENIAEALTYLLDNLGRIPAADEPIFRNPRSKLAFSREHMSRIVKLEAAKVGIKDPIGMHSLRKTWAYHAVVTFDQPLTKIMQAFNHSSQKQTLDYVGLTDDDIDVVIEAVAL